MSGQHDVKHGTDSAYSYGGCRCELCAFAHRCKEGLNRGKRKLAAGLAVPLSAWEAETVEDELAYREGRQFYRWAGDGVVRAHIPRWVQDGWFAPRRTVLEQLAAAMKVEP